jgi:hypothetical protein
MIFLQPQNRLQLDLVVTLALLCMLCIGTRAEAQQKPPAQKVLDPATELKALRKERQATLSKLVFMLTEEYKTGRVDMGRVVRAQRELLKATVDLDESPDKRLAALEKVRDHAKLIVQIAKSRFDLGKNTEADLLEATAILLEARIDLLREELKSRPGK